MNPNDSAPGKSAVIKARLKFSTEQAFVEKYSPNVSRAGIFIKTPQPRTVGTRLKFEFQIADGTPVLRGIGEVTWTREDALGDKPAGMGVKFIKLDTHSQGVLEKILKHRSGGAAGAPPPSRYSDVPPPAEGELLPQPETVEVIEAEEAVAPTPEPAPEPAPAPPPEPAPAAKPDAPGAAGRQRIRGRIARPSKAGSLDLSEIDSALAQMNLPEKPTRTRTLKRRALISRTPPPAPQKLPEVKPRAPDPDSGITLVTGNEPTFEPSVRVPLKALESPETPVELDLGSEIELQEDSRELLPEPEPKPNVESAPAPEPGNRIEIASSVQPADDITERVEVMSRHEASGDQTEEQPDFEIPYEEGDEAVESEPATEGQTETDPAALAPEDGSRKKGFFKKLFS